MLKTILASVAAAGVVAGAANAQGPADVGEYHERFVVDADPTDEASRSDFDADLIPEFTPEPLPGETVVISRSPVVVSRSPAAMRAPEPDPYERPRAR